MILYYITDRSALGDSEDKRRGNLLQKIAEAARHSVDFIQLREKDLLGKELESLAREVAAVIKNSSRDTASGQHTKLLINSRVDIALACSADGVHLRSGDIPPRAAREIYEQSFGLHPIVSISCHSVDEVSLAAGQGADFALFAPVFGKLAQKDAPAIPDAGLDALREACLKRISVIALGGITLENAQDCTRAGATGIAAIRLFQENDVSEVVRKLRSL